MTKPNDFERYIHYVGTQLESQARSEWRSGKERRLAVTISREAGSGAHVVAEELVALLHARASKGARPWTVFDRNLVEKVLEDHDLPSQLARFMPEDRVSEIKEAVEELFGLHPPDWTLVRKTADTILRLAMLGNVIVIGRGASIITAGLDHVFHVRLVGSRERRIEHVEQYLHLNRTAAERYVREQDAGRERYVRKYYDKDVADPLLYHLAINTDRICYAEVAAMIAGALSRDEFRGAGTQRTLETALGGRV